MSADTTPADDRRWLFSRGVDLGVFGGSAAVAFALLAVGHAAGLTRRPLPTWTWIAAVLLVDVAHVWATLFRVYLDPVERRRRPGLYLGAPALAYASGVALYAASARAFWCALAYLAVLHFVRQQYGWVALYKRRNDDRAPLDNGLDAAAIYNATVFPIVWWHGHLPRAFEWFLPGDFLAGVPRRATEVLHPAHLALMGAWAARQVYLYARHRRVNAGKVLVVVTTWLCWYVGIVATNSDYGFTVTNVLIHGAPYMALTWRYGSRRFRAAGAAVPVRAPLGAWIVRRGVVAFLLFVVALAVIEEGLWDLLVWHDHAALFGDAGVALSHALLTAVVPALAVPQATHYVLDAWIWRSGAGNPTLLRDLGYTRAPDLTPRESRGGG
jgi:hypothetical protein